MPGVGTLTYGNTTKPYQVTLLTPTGTTVSVREQSVTYTSYQRPNSITENGVTATFAYNAGGERVKMQVAQGATALLTRYYIGKQYELDAQTNTERLYLGGDVYSAPAVYVKENNVWKIYYICRDYLGSITHIANADGSLKAEYSYDAWGRLRNPATQAAYAAGSEPALFLGRGYTGHEHLPWFGLVNMNFAVKREQYQTCLDIAEREQKARSERTVVRPGFGKILVARPVCADAGLHAEL